MEGAHEDKKAPEDGAYVYGLFLEGARWNSAKNSIDDSMPKQLFTDAPLMHFDPVQHRKPPTSGVYQCPTYKILSRRGTLSTTGHSTNFIMWLEFPSNRTHVVNNVKLADQYEWIKAGVAAFCSLSY